MNRATSIYLDLVRFVAAMLVFHNHAAYGRFGGGWLQKPFGVFGNDAVMIFFVLSGFVISHVSSRPDATLRDYLIARVSRLWSVVIPALILTMVLDHFGALRDPKLYTGWWAPDDEPVKRFLANAFFVNQMWFTSIRAFSNGPMWSIGYEFWYYLAFAAWRFGPGRWKWVLFGIVGLVMGPRLNLLLPIWWLGVLVHRRSTKAPVRPSLGLALWAGSLGMFVGYRWFEVSDLLLQWTNATFGKALVHEKLMGYSERFLGDYVMGGIVALHFVGLQGIAQRLEPALTALERPIREAADFTFAIYLFHYPLLMFARTLTSDSVEIIGLTSVGIVLCGLVSEKQKLRWRRGVTFVVDRALGVVPRHTG